MDDELTNEDAGGGLRKLTDKKSIRFHGDRIIASSSIAPVSEHW
jgi:hypothetical protein